MRICVICAGLPPFYGGAEMRAFRHAQRFRSVEGIETILIGLHRFSKGQIPEQPLPENVFGVRLRFLGGSTQSPRQLIKLVLHIVEVGVRSGVLLFRLRKRFDVVHIFNPVTWFNLIPIPFAKALGKPVIVEMTLRGADDPLKLSKRGRHSERQLVPHRPLKYSLFLQADAYVSKSYPLSEAYRQTGLPESKLFQIASGVDVARFGPPTGEEKETIRRKLGLPAHQAIILFVGGIETRKGVHRLLEAFREVVADHPQAHLLIVGPTQRFAPGYVRALHKNVAAWSLDGRVTFVSKLVTNIDEYMKAVDVFTLPSSREGFSMAILEAMASGLPIVASDIPEIARSQIDHGVEGLLVPVGDTSQLSKALTALISNETLRMQLGQAARQRVLREFRHDVIDEQYIRLYEKCMDR